MVGCVWIMTTEIAIMNSSGIALAADSALTVSKDGGTLHFHGINKIFGLSAVDPVAIMVHGRPEFMDIPWEIIIKSFRDQAGVRNLSKLRDYSDAFLKHMRIFCRQYVDVDRANIALEEYTSSFIEETLSSVIDGMYGPARLGKLKADDASIDKLRSMVDGILSNQIDILNDVLLKKKVDQNREALFIDYYNKYYSDYAKNRCSVAYANMSVSARTIDKLVALIPKMILRRIVCRSRSGIVIAGYGYDEIMPSFISIDMNSYVGNILVFREKDHKSINHTTRAAFQCFGQSEAVNSFLCGVSDKFKNQFRRRVQQVFAARNPARRMAAQQGFADQAFDEISEEVESFFRENILSTVALLPKQSLAEIANNLIMLSSIKNHIGEMDGSVGGPVSLAVITKGDGLIWLNRQHYFDLSKNPHFMARSDAKMAGGGRRGQ
jgi:hypothetical protein